ncbi:protein SAR DEFICIENT 1 [Prunus yedoensis var. nudiflora]|uniref:Protein SAR DEFICIENT 1 n=1 Tax=Prunus yedoensis var. nudiflora TaxID=2094558 RepID=A0A314YAV3_PRUYE|nr:protein SAR DEFICIENT 1 [Prunus yedoensis var. nudiflora]
MTQGDHVVEQYPNHRAGAMSRSAFDQNGHLGLAAADHHPKSVNVGYLIQSNSANFNLNGVLVDVVITGT